MMVKDFLLMYWRELAYGIVAVLTLLLAMFRKKGKVDPVIDKILQIAPTAICDAEKHYGSGNGALKKSMVMAILARSYKSLTGYELKEGCGLWKVISNYVENILLTPSRKELNEK